MEQEDVNFKEIIKKLRRYEIKIRKAVNNQMHGNFKSVFKGSGIEFNDVRPYQYGDDVRHIDWNVSTKGHGFFVKVFTEEKDQTVLFLLDVSASQEIGKKGRKKIDTAREICGILALSAIKESNHVGLLCYSDQKEKYINPGKGQHHIYFLLSQLFRLKPKSQKTDLNKAIRYLLNTVKKRCVVIFISDFIDQHYHDNLKALAHKHDLVALHLTEERESHFPNLGIVPVYDKESKKTVWINSASPRYRKTLEKKFYQNSQMLENICSKSNAGYQQIVAGEDYVSKLIKLFKIRR